MNRSRKHFPQARPLGSWSRWKTPTLLLKTPARIFVRIWRIGNQHALPYMFEFELFRLSYTYTYTESRIRSKAGVLRVKQPAGRYK